MKDFLQDLVAHTHALGVIPLVKIKASNAETLIEGRAEDKSVILYGKTAMPVTEFDGTFGMPNLGKLDSILKCPEYKENETLTPVKETHNGELVHTGIHFENEKGDFQNDYRLMKPEIVEAKLKSANFLGATWDIDFGPSVASIQRLKFQASVHSEETMFETITQDGNLIIKFGDANTHAGSFVFEHEVAGKLKNSWLWPVSQTLSILNLPGNVTLQISDKGMMQITVDSGIAEYKYLIPALTK